MKRAVGRGKREWFAVGFALAASLSAAAACTKGGDVFGTGTDGGLNPPADGDDSAADAEGSFAPDSSPTLTPDATIPDASDDGGDATSLDGSEDANADARGKKTVDAAPACMKSFPGDPCSLDPQCDCPATQTCDINENLNGASCVAAGTAPLGHACTTTASCATGLTCFNSACRPYCTNTGDAGCDEKLPEGGTCVQVTEEDGGPAPHYEVCTFKCQLQDPKACGPTGDLNGGCIYDGTGGTDCEGVGISPIGAGCGSEFDCLPGLTCVGQGVCEPWCRVGHTPSDCGGADASACQAFGDPITANGVQYGYCP